MLPSREPDSPLSRLIDRFMAERTEEGRFSRSTCRTWRPNLRAFCRWLRTSQHVEPQVCHLSQTVLQRYLNTLRLTGKRPRTIKSHFASLRAFSDWLIEQKLLVINAALTIRLPRLDVPDRPTLQREEIVALLSGCQRITPKRKRLMYTAMLQVLCCTAIRHAELLAIEVQDLNLADRSMVVMVKGGKRIRVYLPESCALAVEAWMQERANIKAQHAYLWAITRTRRAGELTLQDLFECCRVAADLPEVVKERMKCHAFRRAAARNMLANGQDLGVVSKNLGHSELITTQAYLITDETMRRDLVEKQGWDLEPEEEEPPIVRRAQRPAVPVLAQAAAEPVRARPSAPKPMPIIRRPHRRR